MISLKHKKAIPIIAVCIGLSLTIGVGAAFAPQIRTAIINKFPILKSSSAKPYDVNQNAGSGGSSNNFSDLKGKTQISDYIIDTDVWYSEPIVEGVDFIYEAQVLSTGKNAWNTSLLTSSNLEKKTCDTTSDFASGVKTFEWTSNYVLPMLQSQAGQFTSKKDALDVVWNFLKDATEGVTHKWAAMESFMRYQHYAAEFGYDILGCELGADIPGSSVSVAFTRGAARQYGKTWFVDFSLWGAGSEGIGGSMLNYSDDPTAFNATGEAQVNNADGGQGLSATRRHHLYAYMSGARWLINEAGGNNAFYTEIGEDGYYELSPHGLVFQEVYDFVLRNNDRGYTYTPYALVLDYYHGLPFGLWNGNKVFEAFPLDEGDMMTQNLLSLFYPGWNQLTVCAENQLINTPFGDTTDVLLQNASQKVLNSYPVVILSGSIDFSKDEIDKYRAYVKQGGTLLLNTAYLENFPEYEKDTDGYYEVSDGEGKVIVYGNDYNVSALEEILADLNSDLIPFEIEGDVQYLMNVKNGSLVLTLINNKGVTKPTEGQEIIDQTKIQDIKIRYTGGNTVLEVRDWFSGETLSKSSEQSLSLAPGDMAVIEFVV